ncbi:alpha/beta hydrolase [Melioribacter sp. OK-6-Me]|uniref:alpha/beta hydrolase n=1 Tax=unclassified Melioribacter TaxID=2627329 RepID=UPI003ED83FBC
MIRNFNFTTSDKEQINATAYLNETRFSGNALVLVHGFKGFKDWGFGPYASEFFANNGYLTIAFNFSHNGIDENNDFTQLDKFAANTFSREIRELNEITDALYNDYLNLNFKGKIGYIGHSRGGAISILNAARRVDIPAVALWASISRLDRYSERQKKEWRSKGYLEVLNMRTKQKLKLNLSLLEDIEKNREGLLNIQKAIANFNRPVLIAHGDQDVAVQLEEAVELYNWANKEKTELYIINNTGHTFGIVHPFEQSNEKFDKLLDKTLTFFNNNLK